jgi:hypothetical protein
MPRWSSEPGRRHQAIGSGISVMLALGTCKRPLFGRVKELVVNPFELGDTAQMIVVDDPAVTVDAQLVTGEVPAVSQSPISSC